MNPLIPKEAIERHIAILGKTGSGKSNTAKIIAENLLESGERVCVLDPTGTWWGMRVSKSGKSPSKYEPIIFGGNNADIPIAADHGEIIAEAIGTSKTSSIIDTRALNVGGRTKFFTGFAEGLLRENKGVLHLIIDEAHLFAPQGRVNNPQSGAMLHAANNLVSLGRGIGLRIVLISQRPAKLHKDSLTQVETLIAMRLIAPQDRNAIKDWIGEWADPGKGKEIIASLPSLPTGSAWVWSPEIDMLEEVKFPLANTFDSGRPRVEGDTKFKEINIDEITKRLMLIKDEIATNDPIVLKRRIAELEKNTPIASGDLLIQAQNKGYDKGFKEGWEKAFISLKDSLQSLEMPIGHKTQNHKVTPFKEKIEDTDVTENIRDMTKDPLLNAAIAIWPAKLSWAALAAMRGRKARGGYFNSTKKALIEGDYVREEKGLVVLVNPPTSPGNVIPADALEQNLPQPARKMFSLIRQQPGLALHEMAERLQMRPRGGHWNSGLSVLRKNGLLIENGGLRIAPELEC